MLSAFVVTVVGMGALSSRSSARAASSGAEAVKGPPGLVLSSSTYRKKGKT